MWTDGRTDGRRLESHTISSPWAFGSGELKNQAYSYTWFHRKLTYSYTVLWIYIPFHILCDCAGGNSGYFWYWCASQYFGTIPSHIPGLWKKQPIHILDFTESWPIHKLFFELIYPFISFVICKQFTNDSHNEKTCFMLLWKQRLDGYLREKYVHIHGCQNIWVISIKKRAIIYFF